MVLRLPRAAPTKVNFHELDIASPLKKVESNGIIRHSHILRPKDLSLLFKILLQLY